MSYPVLRVSPYLFAAHLTSSEVLSDFQIWCSPGCQMQSRQVRSDPLHGISIPNSSSALILLWLFLTCTFLCSFRHRFDAVDGAEMANVKQTQTMVPLISCEISLGQYVCELGFWCRCIWFGFWNPDWFDRTTNQEQLCGFWKMSHCRTPSF